MPTIPSYTEVFFKASDFPPNAQLSDLFYRMEMLDSTWTIGEIIHRIQMFAESPDDEILNILGFILDEGFAHTDLVRLDR